MIVPEVQHSWLPSFTIISPEIQERVKTVALKCFKEFSFSLCLKFVISSFVVSSAGLSLLFNTILIQLAVSTVLHSIGEFADYKAEQNQNAPSLYQSTPSLTGWLSAFNLGLLTGYDAQNLIHELGHTITSTFLYKNPRPIIEVYPLIGGLIQFYKSGLSNLGKSIGPSSTTLLIFAAGPGLTLVISTALLSIGIAMRKEYPNLYRYPVTWSIIDFLHHVHYAYSAIAADKWNLLHDFVHLSIFGVDPLTTCIGILAIPVIVGVSMYFKETYLDAPTPVACKK